MKPRRRKPAPKTQAEILAEVRKNQAQRQQGYRERALALFPHVCGRCGRSFEGKNLRELTVHHKDHNHSNNPPDGSNWELLCIYCHDDEHQDTEKGGTQRGSTSATAHGEESLGHNPFAGLGDLLKGDKDEE